MLGSMAAHDAVISLVTEKAQVGPAGLKWDLSAPPPIHHVIVLMEENKALSQVEQYGPFEKGLITGTGTHASFAANSFALRHLSWPNYIAETSGSVHTKIAVLSVANLANPVLSGRGLSWSGLEESMPAACDRSSDSAVYYDSAHNPFAWYGNIPSATCAAREPAHFGLSVWQSDASLGRVANFAWMTPDGLHDGHTYVSSARCSGSRAMVAAEVYCTDVWLRAFVADLEGGSSAVWRSTALIVTYDESTSTDTSGFSANGQTINGGHIYTAVVSCYAHRTSSGTAYRSYHSYTDWNVLTTAEWLLGLGSGHFPNDSWSAWPPMTDLFTGTSAC